MSTMVGDTQNLPTSRKAISRLHRRLRMAAPAIVWVLAIAAALALYGHSKGAQAINGYARAAPVTLTHLEPGVVRRVHVSLYEEVRSGEVLVSMDDHEERIELAAIEVDLKRLEAEVQAERERTSAQNMVATADYEDLLRRFAVDRERAHVEYLLELMRSAREQVELAGSSVEYNIVQSLAAQNNAPIRELNRAETDWRALRDALARQDQVLKRKETAFNEADRRWAAYRLMADVGMSTEPVLAPLRLAIEVRRRDLEDVIRRIDSHVLRAPIAGQVTQLDVRAGDRLVAGATLARISPDTTDQVVAYLPERLTHAVQVGTKVSVEPLARSASVQRSEGTVVRLSAAVAELPIRSRPMPRFPAWGRGFVVALSDEARLVPGEAVRIALVR